MSFSPRWYPRAPAHRILIACAASLASSACVHWPADLRHQSPAGLAPGAAEAFSQTQLGRITVRDAPDRPRLAIVVRGGDPSPAVAIAVWTEGDSTASTALASLVENRLQALGVVDMDAQTDRDGYRVRVLTPTKERLREVLNALRLVMLTTVAVGEPGLEHASQRLGALGRRPLDAPEFVPIAACTGELGLVATSGRLDPKSPEGANHLERWRSASHGAARVAIAFVGPPEIGAVAKEVLDAQPAWPPGAPPNDPWPSRDSVSTYARIGAQARPRISVALRIASPDVATSIAEQAASENGSLRTRLRSKTSWSVGRISATVRPRGACLALTLDRAQNTPKGSLEQEAAQVAALVLHELQAQVREARTDATSAGRQVLRATDPRDAAGVAAWWSLGARLAAGQDRTIVALGIPSPKLAPQDPQGAFDAALGKARHVFAQQLSLARQAWNRPVVESLTRVEPGQGKLWVLVASPCGTSSETSGDAGITALAAVAAARAGTANGVELEPWVTPDGVGILGHAAPLAGEGARALACRVANAAARALTRQSFDSQLVNAARGAVLALMDQQGSDHGDAINVLAKLLAPTHPSLLAPFGLQQTVVESSPRAAEMRWAALAEGPIRVAVLANVDEAQARAAVQATDRWMLHHAGRSRACPVSPAPAAFDSSQTADVTLRSSETPPQAVLGLTVPNPDARKLSMLSLLAAALEGQDGWLAQALASFPVPVHTRARLIGGSTLSALVIELRCADHVLDDAIRQVRAVLDRLARGAASERDLNRAAERLTASVFSRRLSPRYRLGALWRGATEPPPRVQLPAWRAFAASVLHDDAVAVVRIRPPTQGPENP